MWWFLKNKKQAKENLKVSTSLSADILEAQESYERERKESAAKLLREAYKCTPAIDFAQMRVTSLERMTNVITIDGFNFDIPVTVVGYIGDDNTDGHYTKEMKEWYIRCSDDHHEKLVKDFKAYLETRKGSW